MADDSKINIYINSKNNLKFISIIITVIKTIATTK